MAAARSSLTPVVLNGSHGEGGGALLRTALTMSALTQQPVRIHDVKGATRKPGLGPEDLTFLAALAVATSADMEGDELDSRDISFTPRRRPRGIELQLDITSHHAGKVPGNALVVAQGLLPVLAQTGTYSSLTLFGETHNNNTLGYDAFERTTLLAHRAQGLYAFPSLVSTGFGYGGRGEVHVDIEPSALEPIHWPDRGELKQSGAVITMSEVGQNVVQETVSAVGKLMEDHGLTGELEQHVIRGREPGASVTFWATFERGAGSGAAVLQRGQSATGMVQRAWMNFSGWYQSPATVDAFLADQLLLLAAFTDGKSVYTTPQITRRLGTMAWVIKQFSPVAITIKGREGEPGLITVQRSLG